MSLASETFFFNKCPSKLMPVPLGRSGPTIPHPLRQKRNFIFKNSEVPANPRLPFLACFEEPDPAAGALGGHLKEACYMAPFSSGGIQRHSRCLSHPPRQASGRTRTIYHTGVLLGRRRGCRHRQSLIVSGISLHTAMPSSQV